jgi:hypothetical protein
VGAIADRYPIRADQSKVDLVDERRRVKREVAIGFETGPSDPAHFCIDDLDESIERVFVPLAPVLKERGHRAGVSFGHGLA